MFAALVASAGDLLLLSAANAPRDELGLPGPARIGLWLGGALGVVAIPLYALGYRAASRVVATASVRAAQGVRVAGSGGALLGAAIHGLTAAHIAGRDAGAPGRDPLVSLLDSAPLVALWSVASLLVLLASALFAWLTARGVTAAPRAAALANPAGITLAVAAAGLPFTLLRAFLTPAAPNLAHVVFFAVCARVLAAGSGSGVRSLAAGATQWPTTRSSPSDSGR